MVFKRVTRFAPTPSGGLHFGSLVAALASYLFCKAEASGQTGGVWKLRFDDLDSLRNQPGATSLIWSQLESYGLYWDEEPIFQSQHIEEYRQAILDLCKKNLLFWCSCSRAKLDRSGAKRNECGERVYLGTCRNNRVTEVDAWAVMKQNHKGPSGKSMRLLVDDLRRFSEFLDGCQGLQKADIAAEWGSPLLFRADGIFSHYLANVVDDVRENVTHVVRGADLLGTTHVHRLVHQELYNDSPPEYLHVPLALDENGEKLSKSASAAFLPLGKNEVILTLNQALRHLGQAEVTDAASPVELVQRAAENFKCRRRK